MSCEYRKNKTRNERIVNVRVCHRIGNKQSILVCACCGNEVESKPNAEYWLVDGMEDGTSPLLPRYNFCPWCSAPLKEADDG